MEGGAKKSRGLSNAHESQAKRQQPLLQQQSTIRVPAAEQHQTISAAAFAHGPTAPAADEQQMDGGFSQQTFEMDLQDNSVAAVSEYAGEIFSYLRQRELVVYPLGNYLERPETDVRVRNVPCPSGGCSY